MKKYTQCKLWEALKAFDEGKTVEFRYAHRGDQEPWKSLTGGWVKVSDNALFRIVEDVKMRVKRPVDFSYCELGRYYSVTIGKDKVEIAFKLGLANHLLESGKATVDPDGKCRISFEVECEEDPNG